MDGDDDFVRPSQLAHEPLGFHDMDDPDYAKSKVFNDPVQGHFRVRNECIQVIDTPAFQRLRDVKQLGTSYFVFPGACHNRFEHSLGVCHLAEELVLRLQRSQKVELGIDKEDVKVVALAGLCHDLGHAPFSHVFDNEFLRVAAPNCKWSHEQMSVDLLEHLIDENNLECISKREVRRIEDLIRSSCKGYKPHFKDKAFLREIVANGKNSIDVDKFDYLARDCHYCGVKASCDFRRIMPFVKVIDDSICFKASEVWNIYEIFHTRASLHRRVYSHKAAKAIEYMVVDALLNANERFGIVDKLDRPADFLQLDDTILKRIEHYDPGDSDTMMREAKRIVNRIRNRDLYKFVNEICVPADMLGEWKGTTALDITSWQDSGKFGVQLRPEDIIVQNMKIDFSMKDKNPVDHVRFFQTLTSTKCFHIPREKVSTLLPSVFQEKKVRVFVKEPEKMDAVSYAFEQYQRKMFDEVTQVASTPPQRNRVQVARPAIRLAPVFDLSNRNRPPAKKKLKTVMEA